MIQLTEIEKIQVVANCDHLKKLKFSPYLPYVFTEHGAVMLASILNSDRAIQVNMLIVRVFIKMRELLSTNKEILQKLEQLEMKEVEQDEKIMLIFEYLRQLDQSKQLESEQKNRPKIGFKTKQE